MSSGEPDSSNPPEGGDRPVIDPPLRAALHGVALSGAGLAALSLVSAGPRAGASTAVGAAIALANLWLLAGLVAQLLGGGTIRAAWAAVWALLAVLKMFGLFALVWILMRSGLVSPLAMVVGFGALPLGIAIGALVSDRKLPPS